MCVYCYLKFLEDINLLNSYQCHIFDFIQIALKYLEMDSTVALLMINFFSIFFLYFLVLSDILLESSGSRRHVTSDIPGILSDAAGPCMVPSEAHQPFFSSCMKLQLSSIIMPCTL